MKKEPTEKQTKLRIEKISISTLDSVDSVVGGVSAPFNCCGTGPGNCNPGGTIYTKTCLTEIDG